MTQDTKSSWYWVTLAIVIIVFFTIGRVIGQIAS